MGNKELTVMGWIPITAEEKAYPQSPRRYKVYNTYNMAKQFSKIDKAVPVFIEKEYWKEK